MKKMSKSILGVTLLEVMLVLAIAAMVIVMSVRYYQSATANQQANSLMQQIQGITAAADGLAQGTGSYTGVTGAAVAPLLPGGSTSGLKTPWGTTITVTGAATSYTVSIPGVPYNVCPLVVSQLAGNKKFSTVTPTTCSPTAASTVGYIYNPSL